MPSPNWVQSGDANPRIHRVVPSGGVVEGHEHKKDSQLTHGECPVSQAHQVSWDDDASLSKREPNAVGLQENMFI